MSSQEECHANQLLALGNNKGQEMIAGSGQKLLPLYDSFSRYGSSLRMFTALCLSNTGWHSSRCALHWKASVTKSNRLLFQLVPSMRRTSGRECGLLPIMWPTPRANKLSGKDREDFSPSLHNAVKLWPTPSANNQSGGVTGLNGGSGARAKLHAMVGREEGLKMAGGQLNPQWVEWLMGFPIGWTDLGD